MAENIAIKIAIDTVDASKSVKEIKQSLAALKEVKTDDINFDAAQKAAAEYKDKLDDLTDASKTLRGSGVEKLTASLGLLKEGFMQADPEKTKLAFEALGAQIKGVSFKDLLGGVKAFGSQMLILGAELLLNPIFLITAALAAVGFALYKAANEAGEAAEEMNKKLDIIEKKVESFYDRQIKIAKAAGKETEAIEAKKLETSNAITNQQIKNLEKAAAAFGGLNDEQTKLLDDLREKSKNIAAEIEANLAAGRKKRLDETNKHIEELTAKTKKLNEENAKAIEENQKLVEKANQAEAEDRKKNRIAAIQSAAETLALQRELLANLAKEEQEYRDKKQQAEFDANKQEIERINNNFAARQELIMMQNEQSFEGQLANLEMQKNAELANTELTESEKLLIKEQYAEKESQLKQKQFNDTLAGVAQLGKATQAITDLVFTHQLKMAEGNAKKEKEIRKKQFKVNKAFAIADSVINGIGAVAKALNNPYPLNIILAVASGILATANTVKIASTKFDEGGASGGGAPSTPSLGGGGEAAGGGFSAQGLQAVGGGTPPPPTTPTSTTPTATGGPQKVYVVASDISGQQDKDAILERRASFNR